MIAFWLDPAPQQLFFNGLVVTLKLTVLSSVAALIIGLLAAFLRHSPLKLFVMAATMYVELFRNTPLLIQLYVYYRGLQSVGLVLAPEVCGVLALSLYTGAYLAEVFRSGLSAIPQEQHDAGVSLGLNRPLVYQLVLIPQAVRIVLPTVGNQLIALMKNSSLVAFITVGDLFHVIYKGSVDEFRPMEYFLTGAMLYLSVALSIAGLVRLTWKQPELAAGVRHV